MKHFHSNHTLVVDALKTVAHQLNVSYVPVKKHFIAGDLEITYLFWEKFYEKNPYKTQGVNYCHTCKKFVLEFVQPRISWSLQQDLKKD